MCSCAETDVKTQPPSVVDFVDDRSGDRYILELIDSIIYANPGILGCRKRHLRSPMTSLATNT